MAPEDPYDEALDVYMRGRGWWSRRRYCETSDSDFLYEQWIWGTGGDHPRAVNLIYLGNDHYEAAWLLEPDRLQSDLVKETYTGRAAVIARVPALETLRRAQPPQY